MEIITKGLEVITMSENEKNDFLDFEDEVVDMTNPNRAKKNTYGSYTPLGGTEYDSYGAYSVQNDRLANGNKPKDKNSNIILDIFYVLALIVSLAGIGYVLYEHITDKDEAIRIAVMTFGFMELVFLINGLILMVKHRNPGAFFAAIFFPFFPFARGSVTGRLKRISLVWFFALIICGFMFMKDIYPEMRYGYEETKNYSAEYNNVIGNFKDQKTDYDVKVIKVIRTFFDEYEISVVEDNDQTIIVKIEGNLIVDVEYRGLVDTQKITQPKSMYIVYEVERIDGKFTITDMGLESESKMQTMGNAWKAMCKYTKEHK